MGFLLFVYIILEYRTQPYPLIKLFQTKGRFCMSNTPFTHQQLLTTATFSPADLQEIRHRRQIHSQLGFAYQLAFVRLTNRLPDQYPLEIIEELLNYVSIQLTIPVEQQLPTVSHSLCPAVFGVPPTRTQARTTLCGVGVFSAADLQ